MGLEEWRKVLRLRRPPRQQRTIPASKNAAKMLVDGYSRLHCRRWCAGALRSFRETFLTTSRAGLVGDRPTRAPWSWPHLGPGIHEHSSADPTGDCCRAGFNANLTSLFLTQTTYVGLP